MKFRNNNTGEIFEVDRMIKLVTLVSVRSGYAHNKDCDIFTFKDEDGEKWCYYNTYSYNTSRSRTKLGEELVYEEGKTLQLSGYYIKDDYDNFIYRPRIIKKERLIF